MSRALKIAVVVLIGVGVANLVYACLALPEKRALNLVAAFCCGVITVFLCRDRKPA